jgi:hypothetical protein
MLTHHFPLIFEYGVAPQTSGFLEVKTARETESIVLVVALKRPAEDNDAGREKVKQELTEYIKERFGESQFKTIYAIGSIGLSWSAYKMQVSGPPELETVFEWASNITDAASYERMARLGTMIDGMTGTTRRVN